MQRIKAACRSRGGRVKHDICSKRVTSRWGGDPLELSSYGGVDLQANIPKPAPSQAEILRNPRAVREAKLWLLREAIFEACAFIRLHAEACQELAEACDDAGLIHSLGRIVLYTKHAARSGNDLRAVRNEAASNKEGGQ
jgi:hypothetical protein